MTTDTEAAANVVEPDPIPPAAATLPIIHARLNDLADTPPGQVAQSKVASIIALIVSLLQNPAIAAQIPAGWKGWTGAAIAALLIAGTFFATGRFTAPDAVEKIVPQPVIVNVPAPPAPIVNVHPAAAPVAAPEKVTPPKIIAPSNRPATITIYAIDAAMIPSWRDPALQTLLAANGIKLVVDPKVYEAGSTYPGGTPLPCAAIATETGKLLSVSPFASGADLAAAVRRLIPVK